MSRVSPVATVQGSGVKCRGCRPEAIALIVFFSAGLLETFLPKVLMMGLK